MVTLVCWIFSNGINIHLSSHVLWQLLWSCGCFLFSFSDFRELLENSLFDFTLGRSVPVSATCLHFRLRVHISLHFMGPCFSILRYPGSFFMPLIECWQVPFLGTWRVLWPIRTGFSIRSVTTLSLATLFLRSIVCIVVLESQESFGCLYTW